MIEGFLGTVSRLVGISCYTVKGKFSPWLFSWSVVVLTGLSVCMTVSELQIFKSKNTIAGKSTSRVLMTVFLQLSDVFLCVVHLWAQASRKHLFEEVLYFTRKTKNPAYDSYVVTFGFITFLGMIYDPWDALFHAPPVETSNFWYAHRRDFVKILHFFVFIVVSQFCAVVSRVSHRLEFVRTLFDDVEVALTLHAKLTYLAKAANRLWNFQLLVVCFHIFGYVVLFIYDAINPIINESKSNRDLRIYLNLGLSLVLTLTELFCLAFTCNRTSYNADAFNEELFKLLESHPTYSKNVRIPVKYERKFVSELIQLIKMGPHLIIPTAAPLNFSLEKLNMYLNYNETVNFTACGFFNLGYPMITAITATTASYLVILLQSI